MSITSSDICNAAEQLRGFVGYHGKAARHIVRFSEDAFGMDVVGASITPASEFVWTAVDDDLMSLRRERLALLLAQNVNDRLGISEPLLVYLRRRDLPEIQAQRHKR